MEARTGPDRISPLHDDILLHILSYLPTKYAVRTSILSNRWRYLHTFNPILDFPLDSHNATTQLQARHVYTINHTLRLYNPTILLQRFNIQLFIDQDLSFYIKRWINFATARGVAELRFQICNGRRFLELPNSLFSCNSLSFLVLWFSSFRPPHGFNGFSNLKLLELVCVKIYDQAMHNLFLTCPLLEDLTLRYCHGLKNLQVTAPNLCLKNLELLNCLYLKIVIVNAPNLRAFRYDGEVIKLCLTNVPCLVEAGLQFRGTEDIVYVYVQDLKSLVTAVSQVKILTVGSWFPKFIFTDYDLGKSPHIIFVNLKELRWYDDFYGNFGAILEDCPLLEKVHMDFEQRRHISQEFTIVGTPLHQEFIIKLKQDHPEAESWRYHLKTITMVGFSRKKKEMNLVEFLLKESLVLDDFFLLIPDQENVNELLDYLSHLPKASSCAKVIVSKSLPRATHEVYISGVLLSTTTVSSSFRNLFYESDEDEDDDGDGDGDGDGDDDDVDEVNDDNVDAVEVDDVDFDNDEQVGDEDELP